MTARVKGRGSAAGPMRLILTAAPAGAARRLVREALSRHLAACVNSAPVASTYWWQGKVERATERLLIFKTTPGSASALVDFLQRNHPYDVPEVAELDVAKLNEPYRRYLTATLGSASRSRARRRPPRRRG